MYTSVDDIGAWAEAGHDRDTVIRLIECSAISSDSEGKRSPGR